VQERGLRSREIRLPSVLDFLDRKLLHLLWKYPELGKIHWIELQIPNYKYSKYSKLHPNYNYIYLNVIEIQLQLQSYFHSITITNYNYSN
jgi:hypothetical protein